MLFFGNPTPTSTVTSSLDSSSWNTSTAQFGPSGPLLLMHHPHPTLAFKPPILFLPTLYLLSLHPHHRLMLLVVSFYLLLHLPLPNSPKVLQWNARGLPARSTALQHFISSHPVDLICIQEFYSSKQNYVTICNLLSQDSITIYTAYTDHHYI